ncbi:molybdopterin-dependent oxidoreductase [Sulfitobacter geojensis]|uniref:Molybdopterin-dependent oxidoreductase n=1 Tax=Sulfitobacter geojensis TaxID=1342299 RepID=A0AAE3B6H6_9RHOB|nr:molybdopterin-dependent oxidoreductase [Sulfitobacter geojensis]MBM1689956.1 molybdopterin-dependent oxidoreductase [Sulfitobacter geojensis]MBM1694022.1 molybdopterin-dependent oxidoreductase [Sulfitobacter geojensis]MBM1706188.1 molybdopterin-dependent oxidoreductase [Sulfitobacter geojensis]MBM1710246.1 molybdopterin-dependent oxidoreductase [Sulfitobacter geojensis]MBM1714312.1 molybdopterin-dependent oxidoreductase [Sulfitobacter geojensis]
MLTRIQTFIVALGLVLGLGTSVQAGDTILTLTHSGETRTFDRPALEALGTEKIETTTIWTEGTQVFEGVSLARLAQEVDAQDGKLLATAINDYTVEIPLSDAVEGGPIVAITMNGNEMSLRDKGPLWVVYPYDANADYRTEVIYSRSIWQLDRIEVVQ